jgi:sugar-phosphatase
MATLLGDRFQELFCQESPPFVEQARPFLARARQLMPTAIATSSDASCLQALLTRLKPNEQPRASVSAEECERSKPDPECFLRAAAKLSVEPARCLVFEDSHAGLRAARAAGMRSVAITQCAPAPAETAALADLAVRDYGQLAPGFLEDITA